MRWVVCPLQAYSGKQNVSNDNDDDANNKKKEKQGTNNSQIEISFSMYEMNCRSNKMQLSAS